MQYLQIVVKSGQPGGHLLFFSAGQKTDFLRYGWRRTGDNQLAVLSLFKDRVQTIGESEQGFARARRSCQHRHIHVVAIEHTHGHRLLEIAWGQPPESLVHQMIPAVYGEIDVIAINMIDISDEILLVVDKLVGIGVR